MSTHNVTATAAADGLITGDNLKNTLSDALVSFSPFALLVGAESARTLAQRVTNLKQVLVSSIAPIGALGMMATVCKGAKIPGLKDMLGVGEDDIRGAACDLGCASLDGVTVPRMSKTGSLTCAKKDPNVGTAACAVIRLEWNLEEKNLDLDALRSAIESFWFSTMSGRLMWDAETYQDREKISVMVRQSIMNAFGSHQGRESTLFQGFQVERLKNGKGIVELHWPAPAMPLETNSFVVWLFGGLFAACFITVAVVTAALRPSSLHQSPLAAGLLLGSQLILALGHVAAQYIIKFQRVTKHVRIPRTGLGKEWALVDNTWFTAHLARRPYSFKTLTPHHVNLSQHQSFKSAYVTTWHAILTLLLLGIGFIAFYVGAKSSNIYTVITYIGLFVLANTLKGHIIGLANKPYFTPLNNIGYADILISRTKKKPDHGLQEETELQDIRVITDNKGGRHFSSPTSQSFELHSSIHFASSSQVSAFANQGPAYPSGPPDAISLNSDSASFVDPIPAPPSTSTFSFHREVPPHDSANVHPRAFERKYRVYSKFALRHHGAIGMFYFSDSKEWAMAAHIIHRAVQPWVAHWGGPAHREPFLEMPVVFSDSANSHIYYDSLLILALDESRHEDCFWSAGMEIFSIWTSTFASRDVLCSETPLGTSIVPLQGFVYSAVHMLLSSPPDFPTAGAQSLMRSIDLVRIKYPYDESTRFSQYMSAAAESAVDEYQTRQFARGPRPPSVPSLKVPSTSGIQE